jgi:hypothetical protein
MKLLKYKTPTSNVIDYSDIEHGFLFRGNSDNENIRNAINSSLNQIFCFFQQHFQMDVKDLVRCDIEPLEGEHIQSKQGKSWGQSMQEGVSDAREKVGEWTKEKGSQLGEKTKEVGERTQQKSKDTGENLQQQSRESQQQGLQGSQQGLSSSGRRTTGKGVSPSDVQEQR